MRSLQRLTMLFRAISSVAAASGAVVACSSADAGVSRDNLTTNVCQNGAYDPIAGLTPKVAVDYIALTGAGSGGSAVGTPCATATDKKKCQDVLTAQRSDVGLRGGQSGINFIVYTRGDEVGAITDRAQLAAFLSLSSVQDAAVLAWAGGHNPVCTESNSGVNAQGYELLTRTGSGCGAKDNIDEHRLTVSKTGEIVVVETTRIKDGDPGCAIGRRPEGLRPCARASEDDLGAWFARAARLEAASVVAFERLAEELRALGAPRELVALAERSAADEVRHARVTARLARRFGGVVEEPSIPPFAPRPLFEVALENAVEGQVRETFGALVATFQGARAADNEVRAAMRVIARDETRHSALAWEIAAWAEPLLDGEQRAEIDLARRNAARDLRAELQVEPSAEARTLAGVPAAREAVSMFDAAAAELWAA